RVVDPAPLAGNRPALGIPPVPGRVAAPRLAPPGNDATPPDGMRTPVFGLRLGVGRVPNDERATGARFAKPPLGRDNEDGRPDGLGIDGVRPATAP
ncbi:MAG TPA: hypothetical protein VGK58_17645, partial [Lacipirellulaceae bacterium]